MKSFTREFSTDIVDIPYIKKIIRDISIMTITNELTFSVKEERINMFNSELEFISNTHKDDIITGSLALSLYGLLDRELKDIDLITDNIGLSQIMEIWFNKSDMENSSRIGYVDHFYRKKGLLGFLSKKKRYTVDYFENRGNTYETFYFNGVKLKIDSPINIIKHKFDMISDNTSFYAMTSIRKHNNDILDIKDRISLGL